MKEKKIASIYKILLIFEDAIAPEVSVSEDEYIAYLDRLYVYSLSWREEEISGTIKGLISLGSKAKHKTVKSVVFHMIDLLNRGEGEAVEPSLL